MSKAKKSIEVVASTAAKEGGKDRDSQRFTPLRSYVARTRSLAREARSDLALSRIIPQAPYKARSLSP